MSKITIAVSDDGREVLTEIECDILGSFGVHLAYGVELVDGSEAWSVSHMASGKRVTPFCFASSDDAKKFAAMLVCLPLAWSSPTVMTDLDQDSRSDLRQVVYGASALLGGFLIENVFDKPAGSA